MSQEKSTKVTAVNSWTTFGSVTTYIDDYMKLQMTTELQAKPTIQAEVTSWKSPSA